MPIKYKLVERKDWSKDAPEGSTRLRPACGRRHRDVRGALREHRRGDRPDECRRKGLLRPLQPPLGTPPEGRPERAPRRDRHLPPYRGQQRSQDERGVQHQHDDEEARYPLYRRQVDPRDP